MQMAADQPATSGFWNVVRHEGAVGLWRGNGLAVLRATLQKGLLFATQDSMRSVLGSDMLAGGFAGLTASGVTYPLDVLRTRHAGTVNAGSLLDVASNAIRAHGPLALWRGASATLAGGLVFEGMRFGLFGYLQEQDKYGSQPYLGSAVNGAVASLVAGNVVYPNDTVRRRLQTVAGSGETYLQALRHLCQEDGLRRLYRGFVLYNIKAVPSAAVQFATYAHLKRLALERSAQKSASPVVL